MKKNSDLVEYADGLKIWYKDGLRHREDGPSAEDGEGNRYWHQYDLLHREDGPAVEFINGNKYWFVRGVELSETEIERLKIKNRKSKIEALDL